MTASDVLIPGSVAVVWLLVAGVGTIVRQRERAAGKERPVGMTIIMVITLLAILVALML